jgi:hypothetical protein
MHVGIVGAGFAGLSCARALIARGHTVSLLDKGRRPGGRCATRRAEGHAFDHGMQYALPDDPAFADALRQAGAADWGGRLVGVPGMSALPAALAKGLALECGRRVFQARQWDARWVLHHDDATGRTPDAPPDPNSRGAGPFDAVVITAPPAQAAPLLADHPFAARVRRAVLAPCWALMAAFERAANAPVTMQPPQGPLGWIARDSAKPGRDGGADRWVAHATAAWSRAHEEDPADRVLDQLLPALSRAIGSRATPLHASVHRWRYALTEAPLNEAFLWDAAARIGVAADWCLGARAGHAWASGAALAAAMG